MNDRVDEVNLPLPPRRTMPPEVRARVRSTVFRQLPEISRSRLDRIRPPLAVAASVAVLAAGAMIVAQSVGGSGDDPLIPAPSTASTPEPPPLNPEEARVNLDRCAAALQTAGKAASVPDRATWVPVFAVPGHGRTLTALRAAGMPLFCETTRSTVTVSNPDVAPGFAKDSATAALLISKAGAMGGVVDPAWKSMVVLSVSPDGGSMSSEAIIKDGLWVHFTDLATGPGSRFTVRQTIPGHPEQPYPVGPGGVSTPAKPGEAVPGQTHPELDLPRAPEPLVSLTDKLAKPGDRTSDMGAFLGECIANSSNAVVDPQVWEPVAIAGPAPYRAVLARYGDEVVGCSVQGVRRNPDNLTEVSKFYQYWPDRSIDPNVPLQYARSFLVGTDNTEVVLGLVRADVASVELLSPELDPIQAPVSNGTFTASYRFDPQEGLVMPDFTAVLRDAGGQEIHRGPLYG